MSGLTPTFIIGALFTQSPTTYLRHTSFVQLTSSHGRSPAVPRFSRSWRPHQVPNMRRHRNQDFSLRPEALKSLGNLQKSTTSLWQNANSTERLMIFSAGFVAVVLASIAVNVLFHISLMLAFSVIPFILVPVLLTAVASLTAFTFLAFATAGAGVFFVGTPFFALALVAKVLFPVVLIIGGTSLIIGHILGFHSTEAVESSETIEEIEEIEDFEKFDQILRNRQAPKSGDITQWSVNDVIDELDYTGLGGYRQLFIEERIDGPALLELTFEDIRNEFGKSMPLGDRMRLVRLVSVLRRRSSRLL